MALFMFLNYLGIIWEDLEDGDSLDLVSSGLQCFREVIEYVNEWMRGEEVDAGKVLDITQFFAVQVLILVYKVVNSFIYYLSTTVVYIFSDAETMKEASEYIRSTKHQSFYKSITSLVIHQKPISFDINPFHWLMKFLRLFLLDSGSKGIFAEPESFNFLSPAKIFIILLLGAGVYHTYFLKGYKYNKIPWSTHQSDIQKEESYSASKYHGFIKCEAGLLKNKEDKQNDYLKLKIMVNSNMVSEKSGNEETIASSTASICKILSDVLSNNPLQGQDINLDRTRAVPSIVNEEPEEETCYTSEIGLEL